MSICNKTVNSGKCHKYQFPWEVQKRDQKTFPKEGGLEVIKNLSNCPY